MQSEIGAEIRERSRIWLRGAESHSSQAVRTQREDYFLLTIRRLGSPAEPGPSAAERRVAVELLAALDRG